MTEEILHGSSIMEAAIARHPELRVVGGVSDHVAKIAAAMEALKPKDATTITFTEQAGRYWVCHIYRGAGDPESVVSAYGTGDHAIVAYGVAMALWAAQNPEASAG